MAGRIVVGIDGSAQSSAALEWAIGRAHAGGDTLKLVSAYTLPAMEFYGFVADPSAVDWAREYSEEILAAAAARARDAHPGEAHSGDAQPGSAVTAPPIGWNGVPPGPRLRADVAGGSGTTLTAYPSSTIPNLPPPFCILTFEFCISYSPVCASTMGNA